MADEHARLRIGGSDLEVVSLDAREGASELYRIELVCRGPAGGIEPGSVLGAEAVVQLFDSFEQSRTVTGVVAELGNLHHDDGSVTVRVLVRPAAHLLTLGSGCRAFVDQSVVEIVDRVLGSLPHRWEVTQTYAKRAYTQQYREDDWGFVARELESEGIYYWFDHAAGGELVLADDSTVAPELAGGATIEFALERGMSADGERIGQLGGTAALAPGKFTIRSFNPAKPDLEVGGSTGEGALEIYDAPGGGPDSPAEAARQARLRSQGSAAAAAGVSGQASSVRVAPGMQLEVVNHPLSRLDGRYFVTSARYRIRQRRRVAGASERPYVCWFTAIRAEVPYRAPLVSPPARQSGLQSGVVGGPPGQEIYPSEMGEVRVQLHWDREGGRDDRSGKWMRVAQRGSNDSFLIPRIGWNVLTFNDEGSADAPSVLSRLHDAEHPPAYELPANKTRVVFKTATSPANGTSNEIYFEDKRGAELMFMNASKDQTFFVQGARNEEVLHDGVHKVGQNHTLNVTLEALERVEHDQSIAVGGNESTDMGGAGLTVVEGHMSTTIGGKLSLHTGTAAGVAVAGTRTLSVSAAVIDASLGEIGADAKFVNVLVGGAHLKLSAKSITEDVGGVSVQTIGGAKIEIAKLNRALDVRKQLLETVGGLLSAETGSVYTDGSRKVTAWTVGAKMSAEAPEIVVEGYEKVTFKCGASTIVVTSEGIEFCAAKFDLSKSEHVETISKKIEHN
jgi:type VI secretion system secreted protein VgrG